MKYPQVRNSIIIRICGPCERDFLVQIQDSDALHDRFLEKGELETLLILSRAFLCEKTQIADLMSASECLKQEDRDRELRRVQKRISRLRKALDDTTQALIVNDGSALYRLNVNSIEDGDGFEFCRAVFGTEINVLIDDILNGISERRRNTPTDEKTAAVVSAGGVAPDSIKPKEDVSPNRAMISNGDSTVATDIAGSVLAPFSSRSLTQDEFAQIVPLEEGAYDLEEYDNRFLHSWRSAFPKGCIGFFDGARIIGGIGMWPLQPNWAMRIKEGQVSRESEVPGEAIQGTGTAKSWYLGGVVLEKEYRGIGLFQTLLQFCLFEWIQSCREMIQQPFEVISVPVEPVLASVFANPKLEFTEFRRDFDGRYKVFARDFASRRQFLTWLEGTVLPDLEPRLLRSPRKS